MTNGFRKVKGGKVNWQQPFYRSSRAVVAEGFGLLHVQPHRAGCFAPWTAQRGGGAHRNGGRRGTHSVPCAQATDSRRTVEQQFGVGWPGTVGGPCLRGRQC